MKNVIKKIAIVLAWLALWQIISNNINNSIVFAGPVDVVKELIKLGGQGGFWKTLGKSYGRIMYGFVLALAMGYVMALAAFKLQIVKDILAPFVAVIKTVPVASVVVILLIFYGSEWLSVYITFMVVFPNIYINMLEGLGTYNEDELEMAKNFRMSKGKIYRYVYRPAFMPHLLSGIKVALGMSFKSGVAAEIIGLPSDSIGERIYMNKIYLETSGVLAWTIALIVISVITEKIIIVILEYTTWASYSVGIENAIELEKRLVQNGIMDREEVVLEDATGRYGDHIVIEDFSYTFERGGIYCVMGESGVGKTTLLNMIASLYPNAGRVFQEDRLFPMLTALGNVEIMRPVHTVNEVIWYFTKAGLEEEYGEPVLALSGGQQRRVALLRALLNDSSILLLDEPFAGLDEDSRYRMQQLILELQEGRCVIIATHNEEDAKRLGATVIRL